MLGLNREKLLIDGLVSKDTAAAMVTETLKKSKADIAAAVTGIAGPHGDGSNVPVGTIIISVAFKKENSDLVIKEFVFTGSRNKIRLKAAIAVLETVNSIIIHRR